MRKLTTRVLIIAALLRMPMAGRAADKTSSPAPVTFNTAIPGETQEQHDARMGWWREARFGMFIIDAASKGGNFILNITPDGEGAIPPAQVKVLTQVGGMDLNGLAKGRSIYSDGLAKAKWGVQTGVIKGVLWQQGESDTEKTELSDTYAQRLDKLVADLREDLGEPGLPFVAGQLAPEYGKAKEHSAPDRLQRIEMVRKALSGLPARVSGTAFVSSDGLKTKGDKVHLDRDSCIELGKRYAAAMETIKKP